MRWTVTLSGPQLLARADGLRARGLREGDARLIACAGRLADKAQGHVFAPDGGPALSGAPDRGAVHPVEREAITIRPGRAWRVQAMFRGQEWAYAYARTAAGSPIDLQVIGSNGTPACRRHGEAGRAICGWRPARTEAYTLEVRLRTRRPDRLSVFVN